MLNIVETKLDSKEQNMVHTVLVFFAKLKQISIQKVLYTVDKDNDSLRLYIEDSQGLIQFYHPYNKRFYQLSNYPNKGIVFTRLTDEELERYLPMLLNKRYRYVFLA